MVLIRALCLAALVAGCGESLFDSHGSTDGGDGDGAVAASCPSPCLADAAGDFDGTPNGSTGHWRYLDDTRNRMWTAMTGDANEMTGAGLNRITTCAKHGGSDACSALPGALLVTSSGATATADPAIELTTTQNQNIQLTLRVRVPGGQPSQIIRLYRNSREDTLFTGTASANATLDQAVSVDALAGDRFLLSVAPMAMGAAEVGVQLFANPTGAVFPQKCQSAFSFEGTVTTTSIGDICTPANIANTEDINSMTAPSVSLAPGPFAELGMALHLVMNKYLVETAALSKPGDTTTQLWTKIDTMPAAFSGAWVWSDQDLDAGGGLGIVIYDDGPGPNLGLSTCTDPSNANLSFATATVSYPMPTAWHFIRVVHKADKVSVCVDGVKKGEMDKPVPTSKLTSTYAPRIGRNVTWTPTGAFVDGKIDDVRVFNEALPCE